MFGPRLTTVFRSRWRAIWWAVSILVGVYFSVPRDGDDADGSSKDAEKAIATLLNQQAPDQPAPPQHHANPWAKSPQP